MNTQARPLFSLAVVPKNLLLQTIAYLEQHPHDPMAKMLRQQMRYALEQAQEDAQR